MANLFQKCCCHTCTPKPTLATLSPTSVLATIPTGYSFWRSGVTYTLTSDFTLVLTESNTIQGINLGWTASSTLPNGWTIEIDITYNFGSGGSTSTTCRWICTVNILQGGIAVDTNQGTLSIYLGEVGNTDCRASYLLTNTQAGFGHPDNSTLPVVIS